MDFLDQIRALAARAPNQRELLQTEEATKNAFVMPFINALGYNVFNPLEVVPEFTADVGTKRGEKVDYAITVDGKPAILFECKKASCNLDTEHASQLYRYFSVTAAKIGVLTNGIIYRFYSDLDEPNKMDSRPFLEVDLLNIQENMVAELKKLTKSAFNLEGMLSAANELKYSKGIRQVLGQQITDPHEDFVKFFVSQLKPGRRATQTVLLEFRELVMRGMKEFISEKVSERLQTALAQEKAAQATQAATEEELLAGGDAEEDPNAPKIVTTEEEVEGYRIVKAILREVVDVERITMRDAQSYCSILLDDNNRKPICRLRFNNLSKLTIGIFDSKKTEEKIRIERLDDLYAHADRLRAMVQVYEMGKGLSVGEAPPPAPERR